MTRFSPLVAAFALACIPAAGASSAARPPITQAASGKTFHLAKGERATLRLSNRWQWTEPHASTGAVGLTPVEYFVDPGFREWIIQARKRGRVTIRSLGSPNCSDCALATRRFVLTIVIGAR